MKPIAGIARNVLFLGVGQGLARVLAFPLFVALAHLLGPAEFGLYSTALATITLAGLLCELGLNTLLTVKLARTEKGGGGDLLGSTIVVKLAAAVLVVPPLYPVMRVLGYSPYEATAIAVYGVSLFFMPLNTLATSVFKARQEMQYVAAFVTGRALLRLSVPVPIAFTFRRVIPVAAGAVVVSAVLTGVVLTIVSRRFVVPRFEPASTRPWATVIDSLPFFFVGAVYMVNSRIDIVMLSLLSTQEAVGFYSAANELARTVQSASMYLSAAFLPALSRAYALDREELLDLSSKGLKATMLLGAPAAVGLVVVARAAIALLLGDRYAPSALPLQIMGGGLVLGFTLGMAGLVITAVDRARLLVRVHLAALGTNVILNLLLIPRYGVVGTSVATVGATFVGCALSVFVVHRVVPDLRLVRPMIGPAIAAVLMGLVLVALGLQSLWLQVGLGLVLYAFFAFTIGGVRPAHLRLLRGA